MEKYLDVIAASSLFQGIERGEIASVLKCLDARKRRFARGELIFAAGDRVPGIGLVLHGAVLLSKLDYRGNALLLDKLGAGAVFGESLACLGGGNRSLDVTAAEPAEILFLDIGRVVRTCSSACSFHQRIIENLLMDIAGKNQQLNLKMEHLSKRTTTEKLLSYLSSHCGENETEWFTIPLNRQQLADYLCVDRSAMSWELCRMRDEGLLEFHKNRFRFSFPLSCDKMNT